MSQNFSTDAQAVWDLAEVEARELNHEYVGTEHLLLALCDERSGIAAHVLESVGVDRIAVHREIEKLIRRGPQSPTLPQLPRTPRAMQVLQFAREEAQFVDQKHVTAEHLLVGLVRETDGVAGQALRNLGLNSTDVRRDVLRIRLLQLKIVERIVRPVQASTARKRKMRVELLTHLSAIFEEELAQGHDAETAVEAASRRFGDPAELARETTAALPVRERLGHYYERLFAWRAPETAIQYWRRQALEAFAFWSVVGGIAIACVLSMMGWNATTQIFVRKAVAVLLFAPLTQFIVGVLYFKMRDAMWGAFGSRKSLPRVAAYSALIVVALAVCLAGVFVVAKGDTHDFPSAAAFCVACGLFGASAYAIIARTRGMQEIRDANWALLDVQNSDGPASGPRPGRSAPETT